MAARILKDSERNVSYLSNVNAPPSERAANVLQFQLTTGCKYNKCSFCDMYKKDKATERSLSGFYDHVGEVVNSVQPYMIRNINRGFIGSGNALGVETSKLKKSIDYVFDKMGETFLFPPKRISLYGNTFDVLEKGKSGLDFLRGDEVNIGRRSFRKGLGMLYWGIESGNTKLLEYVKKNYSKEDLFKASEIMNTSEVECSATIITGLGGDKFYGSHIEDTIEVLNYLKPRFVTFIGINPAKGSLYKKRMDRELKEGTNRELTDTEIVKQMSEIIEGLEFKTEIGCFGNSVQSFGRNPVTFNDYNKSVYLPEDYFRRFEVKSDLVAKIMKAV